MPKPASPCCVPAKDNLARLMDSENASRERKRVRSGSLEGMQGLDGGSFLMGSDAPEALPGDGEGQVRELVLAPLYISRYAVTNEQFGAFAGQSAYRTDAECLGWSFVFWSRVNPELRGPASPETSWWNRVDWADWRHPEGPDTSILARLHEPAVHISWNDAVAYRDWAGYRLPTEAE